MACMAEAIHPQSRHVPTSGYIHSISASTVDVGRSLPWAIAVGNGHGCSTFAGQGMKVGT